MSSSGGYSDSADGTDASLFEMLKESAEGRWDLRADRLLIQTLESVQSRFNFRYNKLRGDVAGLEQDTQSTSTELQSVLTSLLLLSHQRFVQNRVASEDEDAEWTASLPAGGSRQKDTREDGDAANGGARFGWAGERGREVADVVSLCEAVQQLRIVPVREDEENVQRDGENDDDEGKGDMGHVILGGPYRHRRQMTLIGTPAFLSDPCIGYYINRHGEQELLTDVCEGESESETSDPSVVRGEGDNHQTGPPTTVGPVQRSIMATSRGPAGIPGQSTNSARMATPTNAANLARVGAAPAQAPKIPPPPVSAAALAPLPSRVNLGGSVPTTSRQSSNQPDTHSAPQPPKLERQKGHTASAVSAPHESAAEATDKSKGPTKVSASTPAKRAVLAAKDDSSEGEKEKKPKPKKVVLKKKPLAKRAGRGIFDSSSSGDEAKSESDKSESSSPSSSSTTTTTSSSSSSSTISTPSTSLSRSSRKGKSTTGASQNAESPSSLASAPPATTRPSAEPSAPQAPSAKSMAGKPITVPRKALPSGLPPPPPLPPPKTFQPTLTASARPPAPPQPPLSREVAPNTDGGEMASGSDDSDDFDFTALPPPPTVDFAGGPFLNAPAVPVVPSSSSSHPAPAVAAAPGLQAASLPSPSFLGDLSSASDGGSDVLPPPPQVELPRRGQNVLSTSSDSD